MEETEPHKGTEFCYHEGRANAADVVYLQIFKANTEGICAQLYGKTTGWHTTMPERLCRPRPSSNLSRVFTFSFVRNPLDRFVSGFTEIEYRARTIRRESYHDCRGCYSFLNAGLSHDERARAFVDDFVRGRIHSACCRTNRAATDLHVVPQVAFLLAAQQQHLACNVTRIDFLGRLESLEHDWARMAAALPRGSLPSTYRVGLDPNPHPMTSGHSTNPWRLAMRRLVSGDEGGLPPATRDGLCRLLRDDYTCFGYRFDRVCANSSVARQLQGREVENQAEAAAAACPLDVRWLPSMDSPYHLR
jgi:hypothetical protein